MDMFVKEGNVDKAVEFYSLISWTNIEAGYHKKVLDFSTLLLQNDRTEEALQALQVLRPWPKEEKDKMQQINLAVQKLVRGPVEKGNVELTHQLIDLLMKALMIPSINMTDPLKFYSQNFQKSTKTGKIQKHFSKFSN